MLDTKIIIPLIKQYQPQALPPTKESAAVMVILLIQDNKSPEIVITKRSFHLQTYAGDFSFPGGMRDITDKNLYETAIREVNEELGLSPKNYEHIGQLDDFEDRYENLVRPFVASMRKENFLHHHQIAQDEIDSIYFFPFEDLANIKEDATLTKITRRHPTYAFRQDNILVWGLTATILVHLFNIITGSNKPLGKVPSNLS